MRIGITERGDAGIDFDEWHRKAKECDGVVLITKKPYELCNRINDIPERSVIHCTITGLAGTVFEPNVDPIDVSLDSAKELLDKFGPERVVLRVDPIIPMRLDRSISVVIKGVSAGFKRIRISFLDYYNHIKERLPTHVKNNLDEMYKGNLHMPLIWRQKVIYILNSVLECGVEICGEPGLKCTGCISKRDIEAMGLDSNSISKHTSKQRGACMCIANKYELLSRRHQCPHACLYCYWN